MSVFQKISDVPGLNNAQGLLATGVVEVHDDIVVEDPLWLMGMLVPDKDVEVRINGPLMCGVHQAFDLSKGGIITGRPEIAEVNPCWWGANPNGVGNSSPAINQAIEFCNGTYKPAIQFVAGNYLCLDHIEKRHTFYMPQIRGIGGGNQGEPGGVTLDFRQAEGENCVYIKGGSGTLVNGGLSNLTILANANQVPLRIADQGGCVIANCQFQGGIDSVRFHNESPNGFTEWNKLVNCNFFQPARNAVRFVANDQATDSFHGAEILDCWAQLNNGAPAAVYVGRRCYWYNGTMQIRVFFHGNPPDYQDVLCVDPSARDPQIDGYIKTESGAGRGRLASGKNVDFPGNVLALTGVTWGTMRPKHYMMTMGPEGGATNGATLSWAKEFSYGPRAVTVDASGEWSTGLYLPGEFDCEILVRASNYEYHISGIARPHHMGGNGIFNKTSSWNLIDSTGWGEPSLLVKSNNTLYLKNAKYPAGAVNFYIWYKQRSLNHAMNGKFCTMTP